MANYRKSFNLRNGVQVDDDNFVVNANGLVGIGTSVPTEYLLNVYGDTRVTGITTTKDLKVSGVSTLGVVTASQLYVSGVVTAASFSGSASGLTGIYAIAVDGWYINSSNSTISTSFSVGIGTTIPRGNLQVGTGVTINSTGNAAYSGIITAARFSGSGVGLTALSSSELTGTINNARLPSNINVGIITAATQFYGNLTGVASTADSVTTSANITVNSINSGFSTTGVSTVFTTSHVGTGGTAFAALNSGRVGVGTALPTSELQIRKASGSLLEVISNSGSARISVGQSVGVGKSTGVIRFGNIDRTLEIVNNDTGNINTILYGTGRFDWIYGPTFSNLMSLTYDGKLGLGKTDPDYKLHVEGGSKVTGVATFGSDVYIDQNVYLDGTLYAINLSLTQPLVAQLNGNVEVYAGVSTFAKIVTSGDLIVGTVASIGIGTTQPTVGLDAKEKNALFKGVGINTDISQGGLTVIGGGTFSSGVGVGTTSTNAYLGVYGSIDIYPVPGTQSVPIKIYSGEIVTNGRTIVGLGTTAPRSALDFSDVGKEFANGATSFMIVPKVSNSQKSIFGAGVGGVGTSPGAVIYNTDSESFEGFVGSASSTWTSFDGRQVFRLTSNGPENVGAGLTDFYSTSSTVNLLASSVYEIEYHAYFTKTTSAGTATWILAASSAPTLITAYYTGSPVTGIGAGTPTTGYTGSQAVPTASFNATGSLSSGVNHSYDFKVKVVTNAATTFRLRLSQSSGTVTALAGSYYTVRRIPINTGTFV